MKSNSIYISSKHKYLQRLINIDQKPEILHYLGTLPNEPKFSVAVVGSRKPTSYGQEVTRRIVTDLTKCGVSIISGLAMGVDSIAHQTALESHGHTVAVQANGLDKLYPRSNYRLAQKIIDDGGLILSEYEEDTPPQGFRFLERNRLIAGLADAVIVTEAAIRSGTLNTASHALNQGKDVFAVPGNITSNMSAGCNRLLNEGALVYTNIDDFLNRYPEIAKSQNEKIKKGNNEIENRIIKLLDNGALNNQQLLDILKCPPAKLAVALTMLEVNNIIYMLSNNRWAIK